MYPDDRVKPPVGEGLNCRAEVTLDNVYPTDKNKHEPIKVSVLFYNLCMYVFAELIHSLNYYSTLFILGSCSTSENALR